MMSRRLAALFLAVLMGTGLAACDDDSGAGAPDGGPGRSTEEDPTLDDPTGEDDDGGGVEDGGDSGDGSDEGNPPTTNTDSGSGTGSGRGDG